jgi:hypothetical protein
MREMRVTDQFQKDRKYELWTNEAFLKPFLQKYHKGEIEIVKTLDPYDDNGDFLIRKNGKEGFLEVKAERDSHTGNLALEHWSDINVRAGWILTSEAEWMLYLCGGDTQAPFYVFARMQELKEWLAKNKGQYVNQIRYPHSNKTQRNQTAFYAIPRRDLRNSDVKYYEHKPLAPKVGQCVGGVDWPKK